MLPVFGGGHIRASRNWSEVAAEAPDGSLTFRLHAEKGKGSGATATDSYDIHVPPLLPPFA